MAEIYIYMPDYLEVKILLLVVDWGTTNHTVELLHEVAPVLPFEHSETTVLKK